MAKEKPTTKTIEDGYFHISNSGLTFRLLEKSTPSKNDEGSSISWEVEIRLGAFGHGVSFRYPILANMAEYFANVFGRLHQRMLDLANTGDYKAVNGYGSARNVQATIADGLKFDALLKEEGHLEVTCWHAAGCDSSGYSSTIGYSSPGMEDQGEGSDLEKKWVARGARLQELKALFGDIETDGSSYSLLPIDEELRSNTRTMTWNEEWAGGPGRGEKAAKAIGDYFVKHPDQFKIYTPGFSEAKRRLILSRLGIVDQELIAECLQIKQEGQATS